MSIIELGFLIDIDMCFSCLLIRKYQTKSGSINQDLYTTYMAFLNCLKHN